MIANPTRSAPALRPIRHLALGLFAALATALPVAAGDGGIYIGPDPRVPGWERIDPARWTPTRAATAAELLAPHLAGPLEALEGRPDVKVHIWANDDHFRAAILSTGLADDSVSATETVIAMTPDGNGWTVTEVWQRWTCARGNNPGEWTNQLCP